jgi:hypothetical protein
MDFGIIGFQSSHDFTTQVENLIKGFPCIIMANLFILAFMQKHTFIHIYMHNTEVWSRELSRRRPKFGRRLRLHEANDRSRDDRS